MPADDPTLPMAEPVGPSEALRPGSVFGRFLIVDRVGAGGVGEVYAAYDPDLDRKVALKVLRGRGAPDASGSGSEAGQGLLREAKTLAQLTHPHVVTVFEVGEADEQVFIAMELVDGVDLDTWLTKRERVDWQAALRLMIQAGEGLEAAHARGVIHRDFKPANVLVGTDGRARVGDFGLATAAAMPAAEVSAEIDPSSTQTVNTCAGRLVGTPYFMAPELFEGEPHSVRSDVYAFCVSLYEAVFGQRPFEAGSLVALSECKHHPSVPSEGGVPAKVRHAIERGLAPDPAARWPDMEPLLEVLRESLAPGGTGLWWVVGATGAVVGVAAMATQSEDVDPCSGGVSRAAQVWSATQRGQVSAAFEEQPGASPSEGDVLAELDAFIDVWTEQHREVCESAQRGERSDRSLDAAMACLERTMVEFETFASLLTAGRPEALFAAAAGSAELSEPAACGNLGVGEGLLPPAEAIADEVDAVDAEVARVRAHIAAGAFESALELALEAHRQAEALEYLPLQARATYWLGRAQREVELDQGPPALLEEALWAGHRSGEPEIPALASLELAQMLALSLDRPAEATRFLAYAEAEIDRRRLDELRPQALRVRAALARLERDDEAVVAASERALELLPEDDRLRRAELLSDYASELGRLGRLPEAIELLQRSLSILEEEVGTSHPLYAESLGRLGLAHRIAGDLDRAKTFTEQALEIQLSARGPRHPAVAAQRRRLAEFYWRVEDLPAAITEFEALVALDEELFEPPNRHLATDGTELASLYATVGRLEEAAQMFDQALDAYGEGAPRDTVADTRCKYGALLQILGRIDEAAAEVDAGLELLEGVNSPAASDALRMCARARSMIAGMQGETQLAIEMGERALAEAESAMGRDDPTLARELAFVAEAYEAAGDLDAAKARLERILSLPNRESQANMVALAEVKLGRIVLEQGDRARARRLARRALDRVGERGPSAAEIRQDAEALLRM